MVEIVGLAFQAVDAFVGIDLPERMNRLNGAGPRANMAFSSAFAVTLEPLEHAHARWYRQRGAERAKVAAVESFDEESGEQQAGRIEHERPLAQEFHRDRGLERLDLGELEGRDDRAQRDRQDTDEATYLIIQSRSCSPNGISICLMPSVRASWLVSSCSVPNGQSQPQNTPRPQNSMLIATKLQSRNTSGSSRNSSQRNPDRRA